MTYNNYVTAKPNIITNQFDEKLKIQHIINSSINYIIEAQRELDRNYDAIDFKREESINQLIALLENYPNHRTILAYRNVFATVIAISANNEQLNTIIKNHEKYFPGITRSDFYKIALRLDSYEAIKPRGFYYRSHDELCKILLKEKILSFREVYINTRKSYSLTYCRKFDHTCDIYGYLIGYFNNANKHFIFPSKYYNLNRVINIIQYMSSILGNDKKELLEVLNNLSNYNKKIKNKIIKIVSDKKFTKNNNLKDILTRELKEEIADEKLPRPLKMSKKIAKSLLNAASCRNI